MAHSHHLGDNHVGVLRRHVGRGLVASVALLLVVGGTSVAAAYSYGGGGTTGKFAATFEARAVGDPTVESCPGLGPDGQKIEARFEGWFAIDSVERPIQLRLSLEALVDRSTGVGTAEGNWQLAQPPEPDAQPPEPDLVGWGEFVAVVTAVSPPDPELDPPDPDLELHGLLIGYAQPPEPDMPAQRLIGNFTASLDEGATFPHLKGTVGDPTGLAPNPAVILSSDAC